VHGEVLNYLNQINNFNGKVAGILRTLTEEGCRYPIRALNPSHASSTLALGAIRTNVSINNTTRHGGSMYTGKIKLEDVLVENSTYNRSKLKSRLLEDEILKNICYECGQPPEWNGKPLALQLEHINGVSNDNRLENLAILCPNCHSQTDTFAGKNKKKAKTSYGNCHVCEEPLPNKGTKAHKKCMTYSKAPKLEKRIITWPPLEILERMLYQSNYVQVGKYLGVSDNAVRKHIIREKERQTLE